MFEDCERVIPTDIEKGECFNNCLKFFMLNRNHEYDFKLVHGIVTGQGVIEGIKHSHAWMQCRINGILFAYDPSYGVLMPWVQYMRIGQIIDFTIYTYKEMGKKVIESETAGPWRFSYKELTKEGLCEG